MAKAFIDDTNLTAIADAIRLQNGSADTYLPSEMAAAIDALPVLDTSDATATENDIVDGVTAYVCGEKVSGSLSEYKHSYGTGSTLTNNFLNFQSIRSNGSASNSGSAIFYFSCVQDCYVRSGSQMAVYFSAGTASESDVVSGKTFTNVSGNNLTGTLVIQSYYTGTSDPDSSIGSDGDLYLVTSEG